MMNRLELKQQIIDEGLKRDIVINSLTINVEFEPISVFITIVNDSRSTWVAKYQVEELFYDLMPVERPFEVQCIHIANRHLVIDDIVEVDDLWFRREQDDEEADVIISGATKDWGCGWVQGKIVNVHNGAYRVQFNRPVYYGDKDLKAQYWGTTQSLNKAVQEGQLKLCSTDDALWIGCCSWSIRKIL